MTENIPGAIQAMTVVTIGYPFDTVKSHMQHAHHKNSWQCMKHVFQEKGVRGFYRGATIPYITLIPKRAIQFQVYEKLKGRQVNPYACGLGAALSMCWVSSPMQNTKLNMQVRHKFHSVGDYVKRTYSRHGVLGFYRGFRITLLRDMTFGTLYLGTYSVLKQKFQNGMRLPKDTSLAPFLAGGFSSIFTWSVLLPVDHLKTIFQTNRNETTMNIIRNTPLLHYWRSVGPTVIRVFPVSGISMMTYEFSKQYFITPNTKDYS